jgi:hypothetical protein
MNASTIGTKEKCVHNAIPFPHHSTQHEAILVAPKKREKTMRGKLVKSNSSKMISKKQMMHTYNNWSNSTSAVDFTSPRLSKHRGVSRIAYLSVVIILHRFHFIPSL